LLGIRQKEEKDNSEGRSGNTSGSGNAGSSDIKRNKTGN
jgi:hypothetical protein